MVLEAVFAFHSVVELKQWRCGLDIVLSYILLHGLDFEFNLPFRALIQSCLDSLVLFLHKARSLCLSLNGLPLVLTRILSYDRQTSGLGDYSRADLGQVAVTAYMLQSGLLLHYLVNCHHFLDEMRRLTRVDPATGFRLQAPWRMDDLHTLLLGLGLRDVAVKRGCDLLGAVGAVS